MAFKAGSIYGEAVLDTKKWDGGIKKITKGAAIAVAAIGAAFVAAMIKAIKKADEFQKAVSNVATVIDTSKISIDKLQTELLLLDPALGGATELTKGLYQAFSAGAKDAKEAMDITVKAAKFGKAALTDTNTAVDVLTTAINAYGRETMDAEKASDIFFTTIKEGKITGEELSTTIGQSIPLFASAGIELEELTAGMAAMTKMGISANESTTQLNAIINAFLGPSKDMAKGLKAIEYESGSAFLAAEGLSGALKFMEKATRGDAAEIKKLAPNMRAMRGIMALTGEGGIAFNEVLREMESAAGATTEAFEKQEKTFATYKASADKLLTVVGIIGKHFIDEIAKGATIANENITAFITSAQGMSIVATIAGYVAGAFDIVKTVFTTIKDEVLPAINRLWDTLKESLTKILKPTTDGAKGMKLFAMAINIVISSIVVMVEAMSFSIKYFANWVTALDGIVESGRATAHAIMMVIDIRSWEVAGETLANVGKAFENLGEGFAGGITAIYDRVKKEVETASGETEELTAKLNTAFEISFGLTVDSVKDMFAGLFAGIGAGADDAARAAGAAGKQILEDAKTTNADLLEEFRRARQAEYEYLLEDLRKKYWAYRGAGADTLELDEWWAAEHLKIIEQTAEETAETWQEAFEAMVNEATSAGGKILSTISYMVDSIAGIFSMHYQNQLDQITIATQDQLEVLQEGRDAELALEEEYKESQQNRLDALEASFDEGLISREEYADQRKAIEDETRKKELDSEKLYLDEKADIEKKARDKKNEIGKNAFDAEKATKIAGVWIDAASAIMGWWASLSPLGPVGIGLAAIMTVLTLGVARVQTALITSQQFVPSKQGGGKASGVTRVNEAGGEIIQLPDQSLVIPHDISRQIAASSGGPSTIIHVSFAGAQITDDMSLDRVTNHVIRKIGKQMRLAG